MQNNGRAKSWGFHAIITDNEGKQMKNKIFPRFFSSNLNEFRVDFI
jgi:hypothetical protein